MPGRSIKASGKVFRDPVHRLIRIDPDDAFILELIDTPEFQRLRRIRQLGVSSMTYHGAEHSRFAHSLGVFNFCQRILEVLQRRYRDEPSIRDYLERHSGLVKAAALLHDIGHGPFSHMMERAFNIKGQHASKSVSLITNQQGNVAAVLAENGIDPHAVAQIIRQDSPHRILVDMISSQLDADRMDYLLRDCHGTGVEYGLYDAEWVLNAMCVGRTAPAGNHRPEALRLCLDQDRGMYAAEQLILARAHMLWQVYLHRVTRGYEVLLLVLLEHARNAHRSGSLPGGTSRVLQKFFENPSDLPLSDWLAFDESVLTASMHTWASSGEGALAELSQAFLRRERVFVGRPIPDLGMIKNVELSEAMASAGVIRGTDWQIDDGSFLQYNGLLANLRKSKGEEEEAIESILLSDGSPDSTAVPIESRSKLFAGLPRDKDRIDRLYFHRDKADKVMPILAKFGIS